MSIIINKNVWKRAIIIFLFAISLTVIATIITYLINPDVKQIMEGFDSKSSDNIKVATGIDKVWAYIVNNGFAVPFQMFILSLIPVPFLYFINIITTVILPGILFGITLQIDIVKGFRIIVASIPHYAVEVFAFCLFAAILFELNKAMRLMIRNILKKDEIKNSFLIKLFNTIKTYTVFVLPLIIVAAFLETYIADIILILLDNR